MNKDLTVGEPEKVLWRFCLPLFGSIIFQQLYNIADSFVAGKFVGEDALAAVGNSYEVTLIFIAFAFGCNMGCSVVVSRLFGAKRLGDLKTAVYTTFIACGILCALLMAAGLIFNIPLLRLINTPDNIIGDSALYLRIYILSLPFVFFYNVANGIFSAMGDSKKPFIFLTVSSLANIGMDILFVTAFSPVFKRGVDGVAWATFICQGVSCVLAVIAVLRRLGTIKTQDRVAPFSWRLLKDITVVAVPTILQQGFVSVGNIMIQGIINTFGSSIIAGYSAGVKLNNFVVTSFHTIGNGMSNFTAQNIGAGKYRRVRNGFRAGVKLIWVICIVPVVLYLFAGKYLILMFLDNPSSAAVNAGTAFLHVVAPFYFIISVKPIADGILRGAGMMNKFMVGTFTDLILRVVLAKILSVPFGSTGIWLSWPFGWIVAAILALIFYRSGKWFKKPYSDMKKDE